MQSMYSLRVTAWVRLFVLDKNFYLGLKPQLFLSFVQEIDFTETVCTL